MKADQSNILNILSPHSDDAALSLAGTLKRLVQSGVRINLITCFSVSNWAPKLTSNADARQVTELRTMEDYAFAALLGNQVSVIHLGLVDAPLRSGWEDSQGNLCPPDPIAIAANARTIASLLEARDLEGAWAIPLALGHRDHIATRMAGLQVAGSRPFAFYEDVPYLLSTTPDVIQQRLESSVGDLHLEALRIVEPDALDFWIRSANIYRSQFDSSEIDTIASRLSGLGGERVWGTGGFRRWLGRVGLMGEETAPPAQLHGS